MTEDFDKEVERALMRGEDPAEHIKSLLHRNDLEFPEAEDVLAELNHAPGPFPITAQEFEKLLELAYRRKKTVSDWMREKP